MTLALQIFLLAVGIILLWRAGDLAVRNAIGFSLVFKIESFTIGFFLFAISTGLPEIVNSLMSTAQHVPDLSSGDLLGSSFVNISLIFSIGIFIAKKIPIEHKAMRRRLMRTILLISIIFIGASLVPKTNIFSGLLLITIYIGSIFWFHAGIPEKEVKQELRKEKEMIKKVEKKAFFPPKIDILIKLAGSLLFLIASSWLTVYASKNLAILLDLNLAILGATILAVGTGLPEISLVVHAVKQKEYDLALGDIFGAALLNVSLVLGLLLILNPGLNLSFTKIILPFFFLSAGWTFVKLKQNKSFTFFDGAYHFVIFGIYLVAAVLYQKYFSL